MKPIHAAIVRIAMCIALAVPAASHAQTAASPADARPWILRQLDGNWLMVGDVRGKPVSYTMVAAPALQGAFTEVRMKDVQVPAQYEAVVFIGHDAGTDEVIVHWMDSFGARYSIPHASGKLDGESIEFIFPYPGGKFRNTWRRLASGATWQIAIDAAQPDGSWKHFARYEVKRR